MPSALAYDGFPAATLISSSAVQPPNAVPSSPPITAAAFGISIFFSAVDEKAYISIVVRLSGSVTSASAVQPENALLPIVVTPSGITTFVRFLLP